MAQIQSDSHAAGDDAQSDARRSRRKLPPQPTTILVADDEHLVASGIAANLREIGYHVIGPASNGNEAIDLCRSVGPDMALLDIRMPEKDGLAAAAVIFQQLHIPVMILSAYSDPEYVTGASRLGIFGYLLKPITLDQLRVAVSVAWARFLEFEEKTEEIGNLKERLENRKVIEQAKWVIVSRKGVEEPEAMRMLQRRARDNRKSLVEVATAILDSEDLFK